MCLCVILPPVRLVCPNYEVVVLQPQTGTTPYLGLVAIITPFIISLPPHLLQPFFWITLFLSSILPPHPLVEKFLSPLYVSPSTHLLSWRKTLSTWTQSTAATHQTLPLDSDPRATCLSLLPLPLSVRPPSAALGLRPGPCQPHGGFVRCGSLHLSFASAFPYLCSALTPVIFWFLFY